MSTYKDRSVLFVSHSADTGTFKVGSHHLARQFALMGFRVLHLSTPHTLAHDVLRNSPGDQERRAAAGRLWRDESGVKHIVPRLLIPPRFVGRDIVRSVAVRYLGLPIDYMFVDEPLLTSRRLKNAAHVVIYRPTDTYESGAAARLQARFLPHVDGVVATSDVVLDSLTVPTAMPRMVLENGVEWDLLAREATTRSAGSGFVYVGAMDSRFDWNIVCDLGRMFPTDRVDLYGPSPRLLPDTLPANVKVRGSISYTNVPDVLSRYAVGLMPFNERSENRGRSPMKLYEYLAAGLFVLGTRTGQFAVTGDGLPGTTFASSWVDLAPVIARYVSSARRNVDGAEAAKSMDWSRRALLLKEFAERLERAKYAQ